MLSGYNLGYDHNLGYILCEMVFPVITITAGRQQQGTGAEQTVL
jgi:hypothetical protein